PLSLSDAPPPTARSTLSLHDALPICIATQDRVRAVQPFVRFGPGAGQEGSGLGLSLVAAIARLHRGRLELQSNDPGLKVLVELPDRKSTRLNSSHRTISYAVFCLKKK